MVYVIIAGVVIVVILVLTQVPFFKTLILIAKVNPYEQKGDGSKSLLILGDSTGYGTGASDSKYSIAGLIGTEYPRLDITNQSVNGRTIAGLRSDLKTLEGNYDLVLLQIGSNDILRDRPLEDAAADLNVVLDTLAPRTKKIILLSSGNIGAAGRLTGSREDYYQKQTLIFSAAFVELAERRGDFTYVDLYVAPEDDPFVAEPHVYLANDGLHPTNAGYALWYKTLQPVLKTALGE